MVVNYVKVVTWWGGIRAEQRKWDVALTSANSQTAKNKRTESTERKSGHLHVTQKYRNNICNQWKDYLHRCTFQLLVQCSIYSVFFSDGECNMHPRVNYPLSTLISCLSSPYDVVTPLLLYDVTSVSVFLRYWMRRDGVWIVLSRTLLLRSFLCCFRTHLYRLRPREVFDYRVTRHCASFVYRHNESLESANL